MKRAVFSVVCLAVVALLLVAACHPKPKVPPQPPIPPPAETIPPETEVVPPPQPPTPPPVKPAYALKTIHFDFDKYDVRPGDAKILEDNAAYLRDNSGVKLTLEGYCDPVGTEEYNRGLGLRRANSARAYLVKLGIDSGRLSVLSFGEDKLVTTDEAQFELNRRVEFMSK